MFFSTAAMNNSGQNAASAVDLHRKMRVASSAAPGGNSKLLKLSLIFLRKMSTHEWACLTKQSPNLDKKAVLRLIFYVYRRP
jgi:hypothetical protein